MILVVGFQNRTNSLLNKRRPSRAKRCSKAVRQNNPFYDTRIAPPVFIKQINGDTPK